jgi:hypothetical protein
MNSGQPTAPLAARPIGIMMIQKFCFLFFSISQKVLESAPLPALASVELSSSANVQARARFEQQEKDLDEINAALNRVNQTNKLVGQQAATQTTTLRILKDRNEQVGYNLERANHKLGKMV